MKFLHRSFFLFSLVSAFLFSACEKEKVDNSDGAYPIELSLSKPGRNIQLDWTKTNISDFDGYFLVRSIDPIGDAPEPIGTFEVIDDFEENTFEDTSFPLAEEVFYKVYVKVGDRFLFSPTVAISINAKILDLRASRAAFDAESGLLFMFDNNRRTVYRYDMATQEVTHDLESQFVFDYLMAVGDMGNGPELILAENGNSNFSIYDDKFNLKETSFVNGSITSIEMGEGVFMMATGNFSAPLIVVERSSLDVIENLNVNTGFERKLKLLSEEPRVLLDVSFEEMVRYQFDDNWNLESSQSANIFTNPIQETATSPDGQRFIAGFDGQVYNANLESVGFAMGPNSNFAQDYLFSADGNAVFAFQFSPGRMVEFTLPELDEGRTFDLNYSPIKAFLSKDGKAVVVGLTTVGFEQKTFVDVIDL